MANRIKMMILLSFVPTMLLLGSAFVSQVTAYPDGEKFSYQGKDYDNKEQFAVKMGRRCGTPAPSQATQLRIHEQTGEFRKNNPGFRLIVKDVTIPVHFHVIHNGNSGRLDSPQLDAQMEILNRIYKPHGFIFVKADITYTDKAEWFTMAYNSAEEREAKTKLGVNQKASLNFYTANLGDGILGWSTFPWDFAGDPVKDGVAILHATLPGGQPPFNLGMTAVHEVGHWLGLYHTFQGGCGDPDGDFVKDTPAHSNPNYGTPPEMTEKGCIPGQWAPIHNYMNYVDDNWMKEFTHGQIDRAHAQVTQFRTSLIPAATRVKLKM